MSAETHATRCRECDDPHTRNTGSLLTSELRGDLLPFDQIDPNDRALLARAKLTAPEIPSWALYIVAFDQQDTVFGLWTSFYEIRTGYYALSELDSAHTALNLTVQCDTRFAPMSIRDLIRLHDQKQCR